MSDIKRCDHHEMVVGRDFILITAQDIQYFTAAEPADAKKRSEAPNYTRADTDEYSVRRFPFSRAAMPDGQGFAPRGSTRLLVKAGDAAKFTMTGEMGVARFKILFIYIWYRETTS